MCQDFGEAEKKRAPAQAFHISVVARGDRHEIIDRCKEEVLRNRGDILDFKMFSNLAINLIVELSGNGALGVVDALRQIGWRASLEPGREVLAQSGSEVRPGTLQITFAEGDGELKIPVPAVPG